MSIMSANKKNINKDDILNQTSHLIELVENAYKMGTAEEVLESLFRAPNTHTTEVSEQTRPKPVNKHVRACMDRDERDTLHPARETIFAWIGQTIKQHTPSGNHTVVLIMDGEKKLWERGAEMLASENSVQILDIIHAASYLWKVTEALYPDHSTPIIQPRNISRSLKSTWVTCSMGR